MEAREKEYTTRNRTLTLDRTDGFFPRVRSRALAAPPAVRLHTQRAYSTSVRPPLIFNSISYAPNTETKSKL